MTPSGRIKAYAPATNQLQLIGKWVWNQRLPHVLGLHWVWEAWCMLNWKNKFWKAEKGNVCMNSVFPSFYLSMSNAAASLSCCDGEAQAVEIRHPRGAQGLNIPFGMFPFKAGPWNPTAGSVWFSGSTSGATRPAHWREVNQQLKNWSCRVTSNRGNAGINRVAGSMSRDFRWDVIPAPCPSSWPSERDPAVCITSQVRKEPWECSDSFQAHGDVVEFKITTTEKERTVLIFVSSF